MLTQKLDDIGARLVNTPRKSLKRVAEETGVSKSSASRATLKMLKLRSNKTAAIHSLQPRDASSRVNFEVRFYFLSSKVRSILN